MNKSGLGTSGSAGSTGSTVPVVRRFNFKFSLSLLHLPLGAYSGAYSRFCAFRVCRWLEAHFSAPAFQCGWPFTITVLQLLLLQSLHGTSGVESYPVVVGWWW